MTTALLNLDHRGLTEASDTSDVRISAAKNYQLVYFQPRDCLSRSPLVLGCKEYLFILLSRLVPAEIGFHATAGNGIEALSVATVCVEGIAYSFSKSTTICPLERPAGASVVVWIVILDSVTKATHLQQKNFLGLATVHYRNCRQMSIWQHSR